MSQLLTLFSLAAAAKVITAVNPVHSIFLLVLVFLSTSIMRFTFSMEFMALVFIMVYVGAIAVLFLFVVMMLNVKPESNSRPHGNIPMMFVVTSVFIFIMWSTVLSELHPQFNQELHFHNQVVSYLDSIDNITTIGQVLYTKYFIEFLIAGVVLLVSIIGAILLTLTNQRQSIVTQALRQKVHQQHSRDAKRAIFLTYLL